MCCLVLVLLVPVGGCSGNGDDSTVGNDDSAGEVQDLLGWVRASPSGPPPELALGPVQTCVDPAATVTYTEQGLEWGLRPPLMEAPNGNGSSVAVGDYDRDGDWDVVLGYYGENLVPFWRDGDRFDEGSRILETMSTTALNHGDLDGDGWLDLLLGAATYPKIVWNDKGAFSVAWFDGDPLLERTRELCPGDIDGDGDLDLFANTVQTAAYPDTVWDFLIWNDGSREFRVDMTSLDLEVAKGQGFDAGWFDWDDDGDLDLYVANDNGPTLGPDYLLENQDGVLVDARETCLCGPTHTGMNMDAADFNGDGLFDLFVTAEKLNLLLQLLPDLTYLDVTLSLKAVPDVPHDAGPTGWGALFFDR